MSSSIKMETSAIYQPAGVRFNFSLTTPPERDQAQFNITVDDLTTGQRLPFSHQACPAVHDFPSRCEGSTFLSHRRENVHQRRWSEGVTECDTAGDIEEANNVLGQTSGSPYCQNRLIELATTYSEINFQAFRGQLLEKVHHCAQPDG